MYMNEKVTRIIQKLIYLHLLYLQSLFVKISLHSSEQIFAISDFQLIFVFILMNDEKLLTNSSLNECG